jgi:hypothetical protein
MTAEDVARELGLEEILGVTAELEKDLTLDHDAPPEPAGFDATDIVRGELVA